MHSTALYDSDDNPGMPWLLAGAAGGLAEVLWVAFYAGLTPLEGLAVAREITVAVFGSAVGGSLAPALGLGIHFLLSFALAAVFVRFIGLPVYQRAGKAGLLVAATAVLCAIWTVNFFVALPVIHPGFVTLMPLGVTLASKTLFGLAMAGALLGRQRNSDNLLVVRATA